MARSQKAKNRMFIGFWVILSNTKKQPILFFCNRRSKFKVLDRSDSVGFLKTNSRYAEKIPETNNKGSPELTPEAMYVIDTNINTEISISDLTVNLLFKKLKYLFIKT